MNDFIELVQEQQLILISGMLALLPLFLALTIVLIGRLRKLLRSLRDLRRVQAEYKAMDDSMFQPPEVPAEMLPIQTETTEEEDEIDEEDEAAEDKPEGEAVSSEMQDILSSVFTGEEGGSRYTELLKGLEPVDIHELAAMGEDIARRLKAG